VSLAGYLDQPLGPVTNRGDSRPSRTHSRTEDRIQVNGQARRVFGQATRNLTGHRAGPGSQLDKPDTWLE
jgi:hypothetical protein